MALSSGLLPLLNISLIFYVGMMFVSLFTFMLFSFPASAQPTTGKLAN